MRRHYGWLLAIVGLACGWSLAEAPTPTVPDVSVAADGLTVAEVLTAGNVTLTRAQILAVVSHRPGRRFSSAEAAGDVKRIAALDAADTAYYNIETAAGQVKLTYVVVEKNLVRQLAVKGNKAFKDSRLTKELSFRRGDYLDAVAVRAGRDAIEAFYRKKGYAWATVTLDEAAMLLGRVEYRISEGARPKIKSVAFTGNITFSNRQLKKTLKTKVKKLLFFSQYYNPDLVSEDEKKLVEVYQKNAFLDVKVSSEIAFGKDNKTANVIFHLTEGPVYLVDSIRLTGNAFFAESTLREGLKLREDYYFTQDRAESDTKKIQSRYLEKGFVDARVELKRTFLPDARVATEFAVTEGQRYRIGDVIIAGNTSIKDHSIRRVLDEEGFEPGEWFNADIARGNGEGELEKIVKSTVVAESVRITPVGEAPDFRDAMVNLTEGQTGSIMLGAGISSDSGLIGNITFDQRNFDIFDTPDSAGELFTGQAFRGAGQRLRISLNPGTEYSSYSINFTEPYLYDKPVALNLGASSFRRYRESWDEERLTGTVGLEKRFPDDWRRGIAFRGEEVRIVDLDADVPSDVRDVKGGNLLFGTRFYIARDLTDSRFRPTKGTNFDAGYEQVFGDYTFGILSATQRWYKTLFEDLADNKTVLETKLYGGTTVGTAPIFEKFYGGGIGSLRGFKYRGVSPRKGPDEDPIGSNWILTGSAEMAVPLGSETFAWLFFTDAGFIETGPMRSSIGTGVQILIPQFFGPVPMRFQLAAPITKDDQDDTQVFSFTVGALF